MLVYANLVRGLVQKHDIVAATGDCQETATGDCQETATGDCNIVRLLRVLFSYEGLCAPTGAPCNAQ